MGSIMGESSNMKKSKQVTYSQEFQAFLDRLEEEDNCDDEEDDDNLEEESDVNGKKRRKLRQDQVKALEEKFEEERRLGPTRKSSIAVELGLEPRQVAVWFQNRRARSKTKQLEKEFTRLQTVYTHLCHNYTSLERETKSLRSEVKDLEGRVEAKNSRNATPAPVLTETLNNEDSRPPLSPRWSTGDAFVVGGQLTFLNGELISPCDDMSFDHTFYY